MQRLRIADERVRTGRGSTIPITVDAQRAGELGGTLVAGPRPDGGRVTVRLPLP
ncbi:hypothetical protein Lesp02_43960 [Lentzea sp. NBRC 105346]|uniref:hypothetical protein n=1 Tax=Lentzea sp. NBRC 105346 TaxID=3032205 RepID=UPI0024A5A8E5|nr:hypothetical protein [Lentzea sp. NBRC 105346]GLZ32208.1 hypothetical protein Lesp02_43960 [Lentzea sp. NBRC 105346]